MLKRKRTVSPKKLEWLLGLNKTDLLVVVADPKMAKGLRVYGRRNKRVIHVWGENELFFVTCVSLGEWVFSGKGQRCWRECSYFLSCE